MTSKLAVRNDDNWACLAWVNLTPSQKAEHIKSSKKDLIGVKLKPTREPEEFAQGWDSFQAQSIREEAMIFMQLTKLTWTSKTDRKMWDLGRGSQPHGSNATLSGKKMQTNHIPPVWIR